MQDRYAADVGDFVKLTILRRIAVSRRIGILWWRYPNEKHNADGKHIAYLNHPECWRHLDPVLFDKLNYIIISKTRSVLSLQEEGLLDNAVYFNDEIPTNGVASSRGLERQRWFSRAQQAVTECNFIFVDPDNGLETSRFSLGHRKAGKSVAVEELRRLQRKDRTLLVYHHHTRMVGGNMMELAYWGTRLAEAGFRVDALRASVGTARAFFLLDAAEEIRGAAAALVQEWSGKLSWHPAIG